MYKSFGFQDSVFSTRPLRPLEEDRKFFVGRRADLNSFMVDISAEDKALVLVTGHRGVGKTSFVNMMEFVSSHDVPTNPNLAHCESRLLPCYSKVQIEPRDSVSGVLFKSVSSLLFSVREYCQLMGRNFPADLQQMLAWVSEIVPTNNNLQVNLGPVGLGGGSSASYRSVSDIPTPTLCEQIRKIVVSIRTHLDRKGAFLNINNLEIIEEKELTSLMNQLRDYLFDIDGLWIVLIGYPGMYTSLANYASRVSEVVNGQETHLEPLSEDDVIQVLAVRSRILALNPEHIPKLPVTHDFIRVIHRQSGGEIRAVLKSCDDLVRAAFKQNPNISQISEVVGKPLLAGILRKQLGLDSLKPKEKEILTKIYERGEIRPKEYAELGLKSAVDFINRTRPLLEKGLLRKEVEGNAAVYQVTGSVRLGVYSGLAIE